MQEQALWTEDQIRILINNYSSKKIEDLALILPYTKSQIYSKAAHLGLKKKRNWSEEEINLLKEHYSKTPMKQLQKLLPSRSLSAIQTKARNLKLEVYRKKWSKEEIQILKEKYPTYSSTELEKILPRRHKNTINDMASRLRLKKEDGYDFYENSTSKKDELLEELVWFANELGRTPKQKDVNNNKKMAGVVTYHRYFGSFANACIEAGLEPNSQLFGKHHVSISENGDLCLSNKELEITNILIKNGIPYEKEKLYKEILKNDEIKHIRTDWYINNRIIVEYFGMPEKDYYQKRMKEKINLCKKYEIPLIDLYPSDMQNNYKGLVDKFSKYEINLVI